MKAYPFLLALILLIASCASDASKVNKTYELEPASSHNQAPIDSSVRACDNFYQHACGGWLKAAEIPAGEDLIRLEENAAQAANEKALVELLEGTDAGSRERERLRTFFASCMSSPKDGTPSDKKIMESWSGKILDIKTRSAFWSVWQDLQKTGINALLTYSGDVNWSDWNSYQGHVHQGRLGLYPSAYSDTTENGRKALANYQARIEQALTPFEGAEKARSKALSIIRIESVLAAPSLSLQDTFDPEHSKHPMKPSELERLAPAVPWSKFFSLVGNPSLRPVNVTAPAYIKSLNQVVDKESVENLRDVLLWQWLNHAEAYRSAALVNDPKARRQACRVATIKSLGVEMSKEFAETYIGPEARERGKAVASQVRSTMVESVANVDWLSPKAREGTREKLAMTDIKVAYPETWPSMGTFDLGKDTFLKNVIAARTYEQARAWARAQKPRDRYAWEMKVYPDIGEGMAAARLMISNGFPDVFSNSIILTAASIQRPRLDPAAPPEVQFGGFGSLVSHELVHVLEFPQFDENGAPNNLWTEADSAAHQKHRTACLIKQAEEFKDNGQTVMDAARTLNENVADLSGLKYAYRAMTKAVPNFNEQPKATVQRFFYAYAQHWCMKNRPGQRVDQGHAPAEFRVNGPLSNMPEFAEAFDCKVGTSMVRPEVMRCSVW